MLAAEHANQESDAVTVVIPTLNRPGPAGLAIRSVLEQIGFKATVAISENCSDPQFSAAYAELFASLPVYVRIVRQIRRLAVEDHLPKLLALVETPYVVLLADDDLLSPTFLMRAFPLARATGSASVFGPYVMRRAKTGESRTENHDFTHRSTWARAAHFLCRRNDAFIYGLFRTDALRQGMTEFRPLVILGRRTLIRIAYAPLFSCLLAAPYAHLAGEPVWINAADSVKSEAYLGENKGRKLVELLLGEWILAARFFRLARVRGFAFGLALGPLIVATAFWHCGAWMLMAAGRAAAGVRERLQRG